MGFVIRTASVNITNIDVVPTGFINYGILASSSNINITSVTLTDTGVGAGFTLAAVSL